MKNNMLIVAIIVVVVAGTAFFGGMKYQQSQAAGNNGSNSQAAQGSEGQNGPGHAGGPEGFNGNRRGGATRGEILSQDDKSITVKMTDGSTKIVILSDRTTVNKTTKGAKSDLKKGEQVAAFGSANSDGSITAESISIGEGQEGNRPTGQ